jgi:predicted nucleotidyltransferase
VAYENNENSEKRMESVFSKRIKAGKRRTYFLDVRETKTSDYYLTITESRKRFDSDGYDRHKIFVYKEDFNKFIRGVIEAVEYVKTELMPDFDFEAFNHDTPYEGEEGATANESSAEGETIVETATVSEAPIAETKIEEEIAPTTMDNGSTEEVDKW